MTFSPVQVSTGEKIVDVQERDMVSTGEKIVDVQVGDKVSTGEILLIFKNDRVSTGENFE
jgi:ribosomal protein L21